ncbi:MAG: proprotein convertase P-domain-containing protein, partial [Thermoanaerobaculia bacterium]
SIYVDGRVLRREIVYESPLEPYAHDYDGEVLVRRTPLFFHAKPARIFDPNPVVALNDPTLQDRNDGPVPANAYEDVELPDTLTGPNVSIVDRQSPNIPPPTTSFLFDRSADGFEDVHAYFHIDRNQQYLQSLGYVGDRSVAAYAVEVDAHAANGADNSFFIPSISRNGTGSLFFGEGGTDDAEDADLLVHEYGHAVHEWIAPGTFGGGFASEARAISEGFGDYWAYSAHVAQRIASGRDPFCFADWDARCWEDDASEQCGYAPGTDCLRRLDSTRTMADYETVDSSGVEHRNGAIWSSALREIHQAIGREPADKIVVESLFTAPPRPTFATMARQMIEADRLLHGGAHASVICSAMTARGILRDCDGLPRGEQTLFQSTARSIPIPDASSAGITSTLTIHDARTIEELFVRLDIAHPLRGDLRVDLVGPDGTTATLLPVSLDRTADIHATLGPITDFRGRSAAGEWKLIVRDQRLRDTGTLLSWGLNIRFVGDEPLAQRPRGEHAQMIPAVAHLYGAGGTPYVSDVRIANPHATRETATLIFTRMHEDGRTHFAAIDAVLEPGQTLAFDDVVASAFRTAGSGTLEILGDVIAMSRTYADDRGQQIAPVLETTALGERPLLAEAFVGFNDDRVNVGLTETAGGSGIVRVNERDVAIAPFSLVQFPADDVRVEVSVISGDARVAAWLSEIDRETKDPMFIPAMLRSAEERTLITPSAFLSEWWTYYWRAGASATFRPIGRGFFGAIGIHVAPGGFAGVKIRSRSGMNQYTQPLPPDGPAEQHLVFIESAPPFRTNVGILAEGPAAADVIVYDAAGVEVMRTVLATSAGVAQVPVLPRISGGRAVVRFTLGSGRAYASVIDSRSQDATYVHGQ